MIETKKNFHNDNRTAQINPAAVLSRTETEHLLRDENEKQSFVIVVWQNAHATKTQK